MEVRILCGGRLRKRYSKCKNSQQQNGGNRKINGGNRKIKMSLLKTIQGKLPRG